MDGLGPVVTRLAPDQRSRERGPAPHPDSRRQRATSLHQSAENEQLLPGLGDVALPRAARGAVVAEERERALR